MPPEPTKPTNPIEETVEIPKEPEISPEPVSSPPIRGELGEGTQVQDSLRPSKSNEWTVPVREMPEAEGVSESVSEPAVIVPEPTSEPVLISEPVVVVPTESAPEPIIEAPISEPVIIPEPASEPTLPPVTYNLPPVIAPPIEPKLDSFHINMARARELLVKARYVIQLNKKKKIDKIMGLFLKKTKITNREVRDLLRLSHDMVNIYMNVLIKEGKIKREGKSSATHYTKI